MGFTVRVQSLGFLRIGFRFQDLGSRLQGLGLGFLRAGFPERPRELNQGI